LGDSDSATRAEFGAGIGGGKEGAGVGREDAKLPAEDGGSAYFEF